MLMFNSDCDNFLHSRKSIIDTVDEDYLKRYIDQYSDTDITDFLMCVNITLSAYPSKIRTAYADKYLRKTELGKNVDYSDSVAMSAYKLWVEKKLDMYEIWTKRLRDVGINPWLSFRMNDAHEHFEIPSVLLSDEFYEHINDHSRILHRKQCGYYDRCADYSIKEVRDEWLAYIAEAVERYDIYGIELDFQREFDCYHPGGEWDGLEIMTEFVSDVKNVLESIGHSRGNKIKLAVRCHSDPKICIELGFDIVRWAREGLIDTYIASPRWQTTDNDMPIMLWKQILEPYGVELAAGTEILLNTSPSHPQNGYNTIETYAGTAAAYFSQGADKIYAFNYFDDGVKMIDNGIRSEVKSGEAGIEPLSDAKVYYKWMTSVGTPEKAIKSSRRHVVSFDDKLPCWRKVSSVLPLMASTSPSFVRVLTGVIPNGRRVTLKLGINGDVSVGDFEIYVNSKAVIFTGTEKAEPPVNTDSSIYCYEIISDKLPQVQIVEIISKEKAFTVDYTEIKIN